MSNKSEIVWLAIGWTMLHFVWVGGVIGITAAIALRVLRRAPAQIRYGVALASLALLAITPAGIYWRANFTDPNERSRLLSVDQGVPITTTPFVRQSAKTPARVSQTETDGGNGVPSAIAAPAGDAVRAQLASKPLSLDALAAWLPWVWLVGSPITFGWLALGLAGAERLRRHGSVLSEGELPRACRRLAVDLGIARDVAVAVCDRLTGPVLVGILRPMILLPAAALGYWTPDQIEMVLLHELAHVRRWDNVVNLLQRLVESALFFHPAVWLVSGWVRREREHCCDGVVVARTGHARSYAEMLLALARCEGQQTPRAAMSMARHDLVGRVSWILNSEPERHAMKLSRGLLALTAALLIVPAGLAISSAPVAALPTGAQAQERPSSEQTKPSKPIADPPAKIQGKTIDEWLAALKDRDPAVRERAVDVLGERALGLTISDEEKAKLLLAVSSLAFSDQNNQVRQAAAFFVDVQRISRSPERLEQALQQRKNTVKPTRTSILVVDTEGRPIKGATVSSYFQRDADSEPSFRVPEPREAATSGARGELALDLAIPGHLDAAGIYAIRQDGDLPIVGLQRVSREEIRERKPVTIVMHPACRVRLRVECPALGELAKQYHVDIGGENWWRAAYVWLGENHRAPRPLFTSSTTGQLEFLLPPGRFLVMAYGRDVNNTEQTIEVKPGHRVLSLGVVEVSPSDAFKKGIFRGYWRSIRRDPVAAANGLTDAEQISFRRPRHGVGPKGEARQVRDAAYSPDGTILATAHWYNADPGEVKLWDTKTGNLIVSLPVTEKNAGVLALKFSPDGKVLAGSVGALPRVQPPGVVVLWDVAGHRELKTLRGHSARITALAFTPDGRGLASGGEDRTVRFWDVATGSETGRYAENAGWVRSLAYSPDGKALAIGSGATLKLWDVKGNRPGDTLEPGGFRVMSVAFAPDGRTLAGAGTAVGPGNQGGEGQVRLFDLARTPPAGRAKLTLHREERNRPDDWMSDVQFTPDGRRVAAVAMQTIVIWDAATGLEQDSLDRQSGASEDRLAISPDGRWLAVAGVGGIGIFDVGPPGP
jgi:beta-lactamase regulating signal transducer with metallopeptidase domain/Tol biopolymer transport system component